MQTWDRESIKNLRTSLRLSQAEFAYRLGCRQQTVSEWELGLYAPANAYGKLLDQLKAQTNPIAPFISPAPLAAAAASWLSTPEEVLMEEPAAQESNREFDPAID